MRTSLTIALAIAPSAFVQAAPAAECSSIRLVYARATGEPASGPTKGYGAAGYSLYMNITTPAAPGYITGSDGYAVVYPAAMGTENQGADDMIKHLNKAAKECPQQKYALGGHSQGGFAVVNSIPKMSPDVLRRITAITMFGSPACPNAVKDRCISFCNAGDPVCSSRPGALPPGISKAVSTVGDLSVEKYAEAMEASGAASYDCPSALKLKTSNVGAGGHMTYNRDGVYVQAAACYIKAKFGQAG